MDGGKVMVQLDHVSKRYRRTGRGGSLRDAIPALAARVVRRRPAVGDDDRARSDFWALRDVSFAVRHGEALGIIGHNGAGKSTILKLLAGVTAPTCGRARVNGRVAALIELGAGFHPDLTGRENVYLNGSILGLKRAEIDRKLDSIIDFAGIEKFVDTPVKRYSSGMQARLGFAVAAHVDPHVLLIDEVLSVGDYAFQRKCLTKMEEFQRHGTAIVFVSHNLNAIIGLCSRAIVMQTGQVMASGTPKEVIDAYTKMTYSLVSGQENAHISMQVLRVDVCDADGRPSQTFLSGEGAMLKVYLRARDDIHDPIIGIGLRNAEATMVYGTNSAMQKVSLDDVGAGEEIVAFFALTLNLCGGTYSVAASVIPFEPGSLWDWHENVAKFEVFGDQTGTGIADLRASINVQRFTGSSVENPHPEASLPLEHNGSEIKMEGTKC